MAWPGTNASEAGNGDGTGMNVLIINCGSSSQAFKVYRTAPGQEPAVLISGKARNVATPTQQTPFVEWTFAGQTEKRRSVLATHAQAAGVILDIVQESSVAIDAVGHRFVHGGTEFTGTTLIDGSVLPGCGARSRWLPSTTPIRSAS